MQHRSSPSVHLCMLDQFRVLKWVHSLGTATVSSKFKKGQKEMLVSTYQVLLLAALYFAVSFFEGVGSGYSVLNFVPVACVCHAALPIDCRPVFCCCSTQKLSSLLVK